MKTGRVRVVLVAAVLIVALLVPATAMAEANWVSRRGILGFMVIGTEFARPDIYGNQMIYLSRSTFPVTGEWWLYRFDLRTMATSVVASSAVNSVEEPAIGDKWIVWQMDGDIRAKSLKTGTVRIVTNDAVGDYAPSTHGKYVVWSRWNGSSYDVVGRNLVTMSPVFTIAGGTGTQDQPRIWGSRVAYRDRASGHYQIMVKTIGSSAAAKNLTNNLEDQDEPDIGDHVVAWRAPNGSGHWMIRYYNYDTGLTLDGPTSTSVDMNNPQVAGDRIIYDYYVDATNLKDTFVWDLRMARTWAYGMTVSDYEGVDEIWGNFAGTKATYLSGGSPMWAQLTVPSLSVASVPKRIANGGRIRIKGTLKDLGVAVGNTSVRIERYESSTGKWKKIATVTTDRNGKYSYLSGKNYSTKYYRAAYDGTLNFFGASTGTHFSAVSKTRKAWPY